MRGRKAELLGVCASGRKVEMDPAVGVQRETLGVARIQFHTARYLAFDGTCGRQRERSKAHDFCQHPRPTKRRGKVREVWQYLISVPVQEAGEEGKRSGKRSQNVCHGGGVCRRFLQFQILAVGKSSRKRMRSGMPVRMVDVRPISSSCRRSRMEMTRGSLYPSGREDTLASSARCPPWD